MGARKLLAGVAGEINCCAEGCNECDRRKEVGNGKLSELLSLGVARTRMAKGLAS